MKAETAEALMRARYASYVTGDVGFLKTSATKEVQAEAVAYTVNQYLGLDTSEYSFGYIAGWSRGKEIEELKASLMVIRNTAHDIIERFDEDENGYDTLEW